MVKEWEPGKNEGKMCSPKGLNECGTKGVIWGSKKLGLSFKECLEGLMPANKPPPEY